MNRDIARTPISVVVPVYRSEGTIRELVRRIANALDAVVEAYEIVLVNDGSPDRSWSVIEEITHRYPAVRGIDLMRNYGQHNALLAGIRAARYDVIVTIDDDLQNPPEQIQKLLRTLEDGYDVVYGTPVKMQHSVWRNIASRVTKVALRSVMGATTAAKVSAFRAFRSSVRDGFSTYQGPYVSIDVLLTWSAKRFGSVDVEHDPRTVGESHYGVGKLLIHALNMMTGFSTGPLRLASMIGFLFTLFGAGVLMYVLARYIALGGSVPGFPFLASIIAIFSGAQLFALGIIGEYLARMHFRIMDRPPYVVRATVEARRSDAADGPLVAIARETHP